MQEGGGAADADVGAEAVAPYPMDYYAAEGGVWNSSYHKGPPGGRGSGQTQRAVGATGA